MAVNLKGLNRKDLLKLRDDVEKAIAAAAQKERDLAIKAAEKAAAEFGFSLSEIAPGGKRGRKASGSVSKPKYRDVSDPTKTWTGKGRKPGWFNDAIAKGTPIEDMEI